jgi:general secretion pathway protein G
MEMNYKSNRRMRRRGFTLLEVLLVLAILVILTSTVGYYFVGAQGRANRRAAMVQINLIEKLLQDYHLDVGTFPETQQGLAALRTPPAGIPNNKWAGPYAEKDIPADPWGTPYQYEFIGDEKFRVWSNGPDRQPGSADDISSS